MAEPGSRPARGPDPAVTHRADQAAARGETEPPTANEPAASGRPKRRTGGVSVVAGGLLQDLEERLRRELAPVEQRVRPGEEQRGLAGPADGKAGDLLMVVLPAERMTGGPDDR
jgi:hypothetical protein